MHDDFEEVVSTLRTLRDRLVKNGQGLTHAHRARFRELLDVVDDRLDAMDTLSGPGAKAMLAQVRPRLARLEGLLETVENDATARQQRLRALPAPITATKPAALVIRYRSSRAPVVSTWCVDPDHYRGGRGLGTPCLRSDHDR
jgi:hypothetical protein